MVEVHHHFFHHFISGRTAFHVLLVYVHIVLQIFGKMRKSRAICRPNIIDTAGIVLGIEELAGFGLVQPVAVTAFFAPQPFVFERLAGHAQVCGDPPDIGWREGRCHGLAAVGAAQAIHFLPHFGFEMVDQVLQSFGRIFFQLGKETAEFALVMTGPLFKRPQVYGS